MQYYSYDNNTGTANELYVPALLFPITNASSTPAFSYRQNVIVPLVQEVLNNIGPPIGIMQSGSGGGAGGVIAPSVETLPSPSGNGGSAVTPDNTTVATPPVISKP